MTDNSKYQYTCKKVMSDASENIGAPLTAWSNQSGGETYYVIFDGQVYKNTYWVERWHIPQRDNHPFIRKCLELGTCCNSRRNR
ncbi:hypothetical protein [Photorhabdus temperata]|uniref:hypothetical protein n=1 Tax=Photorhabdus temperata TaxID=574560 RepID=UPI00040D6F0C|nr:hypothetical protein [Photorhabdus temperata]